MFTGTSIGPFTVLTKCIMGGGGGGWGCGGKAATAGGPACDSKFCADDIPPGADVVTTTVEALLDGLLFTGTGWP